MQRVGVVWWVWAEGGKGRGGTGDGSARVCEWLGRAEKRIHCSDSPASVAWQVAQYHASTSGTTESGGAKQYVW